jgi:hypothetical protein
MPVARPYIVTLLVVPDKRVKVHVNAYDVPDAVMQASIELGQTERPDSLKMLKVEPDMPLSVEQLETSIAKTLTTAVNEGMKALKQRQRESYSIPDREPDVIKG